MKFVCLECQVPMDLDETKDGDDGTMSIVYGCEGCGRQMAMVTNAGETQMVRSLGVQIGHERVAPEPMGTLRGALEGGQAIEPEQAAPQWTEAAKRRLAAAPPFVQGMIRRLYDDYAQQHGLREITPQVMNEAREALGLEGM